LETSRRLGGWSPTLLAGTPLVSGQAPRQQIVNRAMSSWTYLSHRKSLLSTRRDGAGGDTVGPKAMELRAEDGS
jgi:hypothetical protein